MSLVHKALERLPERQSADNDLPNPLQKSTGPRPASALPWPRILLGFLVLVVILQALFLVQTGTLSRWLGGDAVTDGSAMSNRNTAAVEPQSVVVIASDQYSVPVNATAPVVAILTPIDTLQAQPLTTVSIPAQAAAPAPAPATTPTPTPSATLISVVAAPAADLATQANTSATMTARTNDTASESIEIIDVKSVSALTQTGTVPSAQPTLLAAKPATTVPTAPVPTAPEQTKPLAQPVIEQAKPQPNVNQPAMTQAVDSPITASTSNDSQFDQATEANGTIAAATPRPTVANASVSAKHSIQDTQRIIVAASQALEQGNAVTAETLLLEALAKEPDNLTMTLAFARFWVKVGDYDSAAGILLQLDMPEAIALRGLIHEFKEQNTQAMALYQKLATAQNLPSSYQLRYAVLLENSGSLAVAQQWYQHYLTLPDQPTAARQFAAQRKLALSNR